MLSVSDTMARLPRAAMARMRLAILAALAALAAPAFAALTILAVPVASAQSVRLLVQSSPLAGFRYHDAAAAFADMHVGDALALAREPDNPHDASAVRVEWRGRLIGYVPRTANDALAWAMDRGEPVSARVSRLQPHRNPRRRIEFEVYVE